MEEKKSPGPFVGVVTHNPLAGLRFELLERTVRSIEQAFPIAELFLLDNGSTDGSWLSVLDLLGSRSSMCRNCEEQRRGRWHPWRDTPGSPPAGNVTPGAGRHRLACHMFRHARNLGDWSPFWVWSDDDIEWAEGAEAKLLTVWKYAPQDLRIVCGLLEPVWHWNTPRETVDCGGINVLVRDSCPGAAWSFRPADRPVHAQRSMMRFGYDYETCKIMQKEDLRVAQIDLATHLGWEHSTHGNEADRHTDARPLDRDKWGV